DAEHFYQRQFFVAEDGRFVDFVDGQVNQFAHPAVTVNTQRLQLDAGIRKSPAAGITYAAVDIRAHTAVIPNSQVVLKGCRANGDDFQRQFVTEDARVVKEGLITRKGVQICPADTDSTYPKLHLIGGRWWRGLGIGQLKMPRL